MGSLGLHHFISAGADFEGAQYRILGRLQEVRGAFSRSEIYPELADLIALYGTLQTVVKESRSLREALPKRLREIDLRSGSVLFESVFGEEGPTAFLEDLIGWALPHVQDTIEEGRTIYDFVEDRLHVEEVGIVPLYREEGYFFLPDRQESTLHVFRYGLSIITQADERYRSLRTQYVKSVRYSRVTTSPGSIKQELLAEERQLPNPATYMIDTDVAFPFEPTMLPVAKRKLMQHLCRDQGLA